MGVMLMQATSGCIAARMVSILLMGLMMSGLMAQDGVGDGADSDGRPRVLLLGDSISMGYTPFVASALEGKAEVFRPRLDGGGMENCEGTTKGVRELDRWLGQQGGKWDVIHFNFGLHDMKRVNAATGANSNDAADPRQAEPSDYARQLIQIVEKLKATGAVLIFATTTPVPAGGVKPHRGVGDPAKYNGIALRIMRRSGVEVNDLYQLVMEKGEDWQEPVNVHFTEEGSRQLGIAVADVILRVLKERQRAQPGAGEERLKTGPPAR